MTFDILLDINRWTIGCMVISTARENMGHHFVSVVRFELDQIIMALCRTFDVIKQLSTL